MPKGKTSATAISGKDVMNWFRDANAELVDFVLEQVLSERKASIEKRASRVAAMAKARAARKPRLAKPNIARTGQSSASEPLPAETVTA